MRVLESSDSLEDETNMTLSGAKLLDRRQVSIRDVTFCIRFNFKLLGGEEKAGAGTTGSRSRLITIEDWRETAEVPTNKQD